MAEKRKTPSSKTININGDGNIAGNNNFSIFQKSNQTTNLSTQEFLSLLDSVQKLLDQSHEKSVVSQAIGLEVEAVKELVNKPTPEVKPVILNKLKHVEELLKTGLGLGTLAVQLTPIIEKMTGWIMSNL